MPDNEADTTNQHHHILSLQTNASLIRVVNSKIYVPFISEKNKYIHNFCFRFVQLQLFSSVQLELELHKDFQILQQ